jgi:hypothetical protein
MKYCATNNSICDTIICVNIQLGYQGYILGVMNAAAAFHERSGYGYTPIPATFPRNVKAAVYHEKMTGSAGR